MAIVNKLRYNSTDLTFQGGTSGFQLTENGWKPTVAIPLANGDPGLMTESIALIAEGSSHDNLSTYLQTLALFQRYAAMYKRDTLWNTAVWMHAKMDGETGEARALVDTIVWSWESSPYGSVPNTQYAINASVQIVRHPYWERTTSREFPTTNPIAAAAAISYDYTWGASGPVHDIVGDSPARIESFFVANATGGVTMGRFWLGIRGAEKHGAITNFVSVWECEDGTNSAGAVDTVDATASGGDMVRFTPGSDDTWLKVLTLKLSDVTANYGDNLGRFLWLLRCKNNGTATYQIRLRFGYSGMDDADHVFGPIQEFSYSGYEFVEIGQSAIPLRNWQAATADMTASYEADCQVQIWAKRTSGSVEIDLDCLVRIPIDQGFLVVRDAAISSNDFFIFNETPLGETQCVNYESGTPVLTEFLDFDQWNFRLPPGDGRMIISYARPTGTVLTDQIGAGQAAGWDGYYERWASLRGAE